MAWTCTAANSAAVRVPISRGTTPRRYASIGSTFITSNPESPLVTISSPRYLLPFHLRNDPALDGRTRIGPSTACDRSPCTARNPPSVVIVHSSVDDGRAITDAPLRSDSCQLPVAPIRPLLAAVASAMRTG